MTRLVPIDTSIRIGHHTVCVFKAEQEESFYSTSNRILASENSVSRFPTPKNLAIIYQTRNNANILAGPDIKELWARAKQKPNELEIRPR
jgi:hypothetical protein